MFFISNLVSQLCSTLISLSPVDALDSAISSLCSAIIGVLRSVNL